MTETISETRFYKVVYSRFMGVIKFVRKRDNKESYWSTGIFAEQMMDEIPNMTVKELNEKAQKFEYH